MSYRTLPDGRIWFPKRGRPPQCPDGYIRTNDPYIFKPIPQVVCTFKIEKEYIQECGKKVLRTYCLMNEVFVNEGICNNCEVPLL